jgi:alginate O-acetyltransferase complex protein AlgI
MIFASNVFLFLYLPLFLGIYFICPQRARSLVIVLGSYIFYAWWRPDFLLLFMAITYLNYLFGLFIKVQLDREHPTKALHLLWLGIAGNLTTLAYFKYANFGAETLNLLLQPLGFNTLVLEKILLPLGISFYIFHALSYIIDIYRKNATPTHNIIDFAAFVALFPHLVAGPILRYSKMAPQLALRTHNMDLFSLGVCRFMQGFIMKVLIADNLASLNILFLSQHNLSLIEAWLGLLASSLQLYFDFAGYSCMAIGLALMMGFHFPENFNQPYVSQSITEFWQRWHLTLAHFLRDYVYLPLVRRRFTGPLTALVYTMLLSGLWHSGSFAFLSWGLFFGLAMVVERRFNLSTRLGSPYRFLRNARTMLLAALSMPLFFTNDLAHSLQIYAALFGMNGLGNLDLFVLGASQLSLAFIFLAIAWVVLAGRHNLRFYAGTPTTPSTVRRVSGWNAMWLWLGFAISLTSLAAHSFSPFLYFEF